MLRILTFLVLFDLLITQSDAQTKVQHDSIPRHHKNLICLDPLYTVGGLLNLSYQYCPSGKFGLGIHSYYDLKNREEWQRNYRLFMLEQQVRFYPFRRAPQGFHIGTYLLYGHSSFEIGYDTTNFDEWELPFDIYIPGKVSSFSPGVMAGYSFLIKRRLAIDLSFKAGPNYSWSQGAESNSILDEDSVHWIEIELGWAFK